MRILERLDIRYVKNLCKHLHCTEDELHSFYQYPDRWYRRSKIDVKGKTRPIAVPLGRFYQVTKNLQSLLSRIALPAYLHGGVKNHSPITNAALHVGKTAVLKFDLQDFFPRIRPRQVYKLFYERLGCSRRVARVLTRLVTLDGGLPQGSPTSTTVANLVIVPLARRLSRLAISHKSDYTQFVDDGAISGPGYLERLRPLIEEIIRQEGFRASPKPHKRLTLYRHQEQVITGVKVNRRIEAPHEKVREVSALLDAAKEQISVGVGLTEKQIRSLTGKVQHIRNLDPDVGLSFHQKLINITTNSRISMA